MDVPDEFNTFCRGFHQDIDLVHPSLDSVIAASLRQLAPPQQAVLKGFLQERMKGTGQDLLALWNASPAFFHLKHPEDACRLFEKVLARL
jgi:hypothetical protein